MVADQSDEFQAHFMGTHFYNPPSKLIANELIFHSRNSPELKKFAFDFCSRVLRRQNIITMNVPAFAGNRIGFQFLNHAAQTAEKMGVQKTDYLLGSYTGRALPPLATIDLVGFDVHKAIVDNVYDKVEDELHSTYKIPDYMNEMISKDMLGMKTPENGGFFKRGADKSKLALNINKQEHQSIDKIKIDFVEAIKANIRDGSYAKAIEILKTTQEEDAKLVRKFILDYISYSFHRIGEVTPKEDSIHGIDRVMAYGFSWLPPSGWVDLLGGVGASIKLMEKEDVPVPETLKGISSLHLCKLSNIKKFLIAR